MSEKDLRARIRYANSITSRALRNICEDAHPGDDFDSSCAWCQIKRALDLRVRNWRDEPVIDKESA